MEPQPIRFLPKLNHKVSVILRGCAIHEIVSQKTDDGPHTHSALIDLDLIEAPAGSRLAGA